MHKVTGKVSTVACQLLDRVVQFSYTCYLRVGGTGLVGHQDYPLCTYQAEPLTG